MTKQERKLTKKLLKEIERVAAHMRQSKYDLPIKEAQLALLDENGEGIGLFMTVGIDEETGEVLIDRSLEEIYNEEENEEDRKEEKRGSVLKKEEEKERKGKDRKG